MNTWVATAGLILSSGKCISLEVKAFSFSLPILQSTVESASSHYTCESVEAPPLGFCRCDIATQSDRKRISLKVKELPLGLPILQSAIGSTSSHHTCESVEAPPLGFGRCDIAMRFDHNHILL